MGDSLFTIDHEGRFTPTDRSRGPWSPDALHGGPVAALVAHCAEPLLAPLRPVRLTLELLRPVPLAPLSVTGDVVRPGRKVQLVAVEVRDGDTLVASARVLGIRVDDVPVPDQAADPGAPAPPAEGRDSHAQDVGYDAFHNHGVEHRFVAGAFDQPGPATDWIRLRVPVVDGAEVTPFQRAVAAADFGNGISRITDFTQLVFINPDLTVYVDRPPVGEWVCLDARSRLHPEGIGIAESALWDERGRIGRSVQSLIVERR